MGSVEASILAALEKLLSPLTYRAPGAFQSQIAWLNERTVRYNKILA